MRICDVPRRYNWDDGDAVLARDSVRGGVFDVAFGGDLFCWPSSKSCEVESTSATSASIDADGSSSSSICIDVSLIRLTINGLRTGFDHGCC